MTPSILASFGTGIIIGAGATVIAFLLFLMIKEALDYKIERTVEDEVKKQSKRR